MRNLLGIAFVHLAAVGLDEEFRHGSRTIHRAGESAITSRSGCLQRQCSDFRSQNRRAEGFFSLLAALPFRQGYPLPPPREGCFRASDKPQQHDESEDGASFSPACCNAGSAHLSSRAKPRSAATNNSL